MLNFLNTREIALITWVTILLVYTFSTQQKQAKKVLTSALKKNIVLVFLSLSLYVFLIVIILSSYDFWDSSRLKDTSFWFITAIFVTFNSIRKAQSERDYFVKEINGLVTFTTVADFLLNKYTLALWQELILLPAITFLAYAIAFLNHSPQPSTGLRILNRIQTIVILFLSGYTIYRLIEDIRNVMQSTTIIDFSFPILLSFTLIPFIYFLYLYVGYETGLTSLKVILNNEKLFKQVQFKVIMHFGIRLTSFKRWWQSIGRSPIHNIIEFQESLQKMNYIIKTEKNPPIIKPEEGWSPYEAKNFLLPEIETGYYFDDNNGSWIATSPCKQLTNESSFMIPNNVSYYIAGDQTTAKNLKLSLNINERATAKQAHLELITLSRLLFESSIGKDFPKEIEERLLTGSEISVNLGNKKASILRNDWPTGKGYSITMQIEVMQ